MDAMPGGRGGGRAVNKQDVVTHTETHKEADTMHVSIVSSRD